MTARFTDRVPLRTLADIGLEGTAAIPVIYGPCTVTALPIDSAGNLWIIADHVLRGDAIRGIDVDGTPTGGYALRHFTPAGGGPIAILELAGRYPGADVRVKTNSGRVDARTGRQITNPADIMRDIITVIAGIWMPGERWYALREETHAAGLRCAGVISGREQTIKREIDGIAASVGMIWSPTMRRIGRLLPSLQAPMLRLTEREILTITAQTSLRKVAGQVRYIYRDEDGVVRQEEKTTLLPGAVVEIDSGWIVDGRVAALIVDRIAAQLSSSRWRVKCTIPSCGAYIGDRITIEHPLCPISNALIVSRQDSTGRTTIVAVG